MRHCGSIAGVALEADRDFIVYGHAAGLLAQCRDLDEAKRFLHGKLAEANECNCISDLAIFRWSHEKWVPALSPYEVQEWELEKNPSRIIRFP
jgi:hypothetical protein